MPMKCHSDYCSSTRICFVLITVAILGLLLQEPMGLQDSHTTSLRPEVSETKAKQIYDTCDAMFNIGKRENVVINEGVNGLIVPEATRTVEKIWQAKEEGIIEEELYRDLSILLPQLLRDNATLSPDLANVPPRLSLMQGRVPYLQCRLQEVDSQFLQKCTLHRADKGLNTWIAFVGDSKMREKFEYLLLSTRHMDWNITVLEAKEKRVVDYKEAIEMLDWKWHDSMDAVSRTESGVRLSLVWDTHVTYTLPYGNMVEELFSWAYKDVPVPNVVVIGTGTWMAAQTFDHIKEYAERSGTFEAIDQVIDKWIRARPLLKALAAKTLVLLWTQSRFREHLETIVDPDITRVNTDVKWEAHLYYKYFRMGNLNLVDMAMWYSGRGTGAVLWDSSLPFNLANVEECRVAGQSRKRGENPPGFYYSPWWACDDTQHSSDNTHHAEATMVWNYLCNQFVNPAQNAQEYCCT